MSKADVAKAIPKVAKEAQDVESAHRSIAMDDARLLVPALHNGRCYGLVPALTTPCLCAVDV
jgi:hypothetical protein